MKIIEPNLKFNGRFSYRQSTSMIVLHHAAAKTCSVYDVHSWHIGNGWIGIGYHYFVRKDGSIYRGRPENAVGAHATGVNSTSIGICAEGDFMTEAMATAQMNAIIALVADIEKRYGNKLKVVRHMDVGYTDCPGNKYPFIAILNSWKEYDDMTTEQVKNIVKQEMDKTVYKKISDVPAYYKEAIQWFVDKGFLNGTSDGVLDLDETMCRILTVVYRDLNK